MCEAEAIVNSRPLTVNQLTDPDSPKDFRVMNYGGKTMRERAMSHVGSAEASTTKKEERCRHKYKHAKTSKRA